MSCEASSRTWCHPLVHMQRYARSYQHHICHEYLLPPHRAEHLPHPLRVPRRRAVPYRPPFPPGCARSHGVGYLLFGAMACHAAAARQHTAVPAVAPQDTLDALSKAIIIDGLQKATRPREHPLLPLSALVAALCFARFRWSLLSVSGGRVRLYRAAAEGVGVLRIPDGLLCVRWACTAARSGRTLYATSFSALRAPIYWSAAQTHGRSHRIASHRIASHRRRGVGPPARLPTHKPARTQLLRGRQPSSRHTGTYAQGR